MSAATERLNEVRSQLRSRWLALAERERRAALLAAAVLGLYLLWAVALAPAWRTAQRAPAELEALDLTRQDMQRLAAETRELRAVTPVAADQAQAALNAATARLQAHGKLSLQGQRAVLTLQGASGEEIAAWLAEARAGARARAIESQLSRTPKGVYNGSIVVALEGSR